MPDPFDDAVREEAGVVVSSVLCVDGLSWLGVPRRAFGEGEKGAGAGHLTARRPRGQQTAFWMVTLAGAKQPRLVSVARWMAPMKESAAVELIAPMK